MSDLDQIRRAICEKPDDTGLRLIFADALEESGDPMQAQFVRVMCMPGFGHCEYSQAGKPRHSFTNPDHRLLCSQCDHHYYAWDYIHNHSLGHLGGIDGALVGVYSGPDVAVTIEFAKKVRIKTHFDRGLIARVECTQSDFLAHAEAIFRHSPVTDVRLTDRIVFDHHWPDDGAEFGGFAWSDEVHGVDLRGPAIASQLNKLMAGWHRIRNSHRSWMWYDTKDAAEQALSQACVAYGRKLAGLPPITIN